VSKSRTICYLKPNSVVGTDRGEPIGSKMKL
jgi:hypothetical protein